MALSILRRLQRSRNEYAFKNVNICQSFILKRFSSKLTSFQRPSKTLSASKKKHESHKKFQTKNPIILGESTARKMLYSVQFVAVGLFAYSIYAFAMFWSVNDLLLPSIVVVNIGVLLLTRAIVFAQASSITLLPGYRLRFDRYSWFARTKLKNGVEVESNQ